MWPSIPATWLSREETSIKASHSRFAVSFCCLSIEATHTHANTQSRKDATQSSYCETKSQKTHSRSDVNVFGFMQTHQTRAETNVEYVGEEGEEEEGNERGEQQEKRKISICRCSVVSCVNINIDVIVGSIYFCNDFDWPPHAWWVLRCACECTVQWLMLIWMSVTNRNLCQYWFN